MVLVHTAWPSMCEAMVSPMAPLRPNTPGVKEWPDLVTHAYNPSIWKLRQEDHHKFKVSLGFNNNNTTKREARNLWSIWGKGFLQKGNWKMKCFVGY